MCKTIGYLVLIVYCLSFFTYSAHADQYSLEKGNKLIKKARLLNYKKLDDWINKSIRRNGKKVVAEPHFQEVLSRNILKVEKAIKEQKKDEQIESDFTPPRGPLFGGAINYSATFAEQNNGVVGGASSGGGSGAGGLGGNTQTLLINTMAMINMTHMFNILYMRFIQTPELPSNITNLQSGDSNTFQIPENIFSAGYTYSLNKNWSGQMQSTYSDAQKWGDPSLGILYRQNRQKAYFNFRNTNYKLAVILPVSEISQNIGRVTTLSFSAGISDVSRQFSFFAQGSFGWSLYNKEETADMILANLGINLNSQPTQPGFPGGAPPDLTQMANIDVNLLSREITQTNASFGGSYNINRFWSIGSNATLTYAYLESTYSSWTTSVKILQTSYNYMPFRISGSIGMQSETGEKLVLPELMSYTISLSIPFGIGGMMGSSGGQQGGPIGN
jgi:hypothetical protein